MKILRGQLSREIGVSFVPVSRNAFKMSIILQYMPPLFARAYVGFSRLLLGTYHVTKEAPSFSLASGQL